MLNNICIDPKKTLHGFSKTQFRLRDECREPNFKKGIERVQKGYSEGLQGWSKNLNSFSELVPEPVL